MFGEQSLAGPHFDDGDRIRGSEQTVDLSCLLGHRLTEYRMNIRAGVKVAGPTDARAAVIGMPHVVAELWVVEGQVHETDEGDGPQDSDLGRNGGNEFRVSYDHKESPYQPGTWKKETPIAHGYISPISATGNK
jgi:hypothetical protein